ncbi:AsnC family transcriptional regulator [Halosimplex rubrum]|jgi:DNA-binding Lrp family transcriptional regulator/YHS domain-containing protein|uniref:AsnC family transcriptional regulator n=1 Tax=Halosimplex rubrum TaxID=869889 RepID=A0A7D5SR97_9EURY|nr:MULTISPECIES: AsnC family transcriptional regulator [Halobacteriales]MCD2201313.1 AsnC family transcriptional regulator [Halobacterium sp. KA-4]QLH78387.1 AsnC family transcriptional regulator [Halosimplex rubrum]
MRDLDETDLEIIQLLMLDARRPYSEIADVVDLSAPAVSDRVERLQEMGIINRFTLDVDRSQLRGGIPVLITLDVESASHSAASIKDDLIDEGAIEHVFTTAEADLVLYARVPDTDIASWLADTIDTGAVDDFEVTLLAGANWAPELGETEFALSCAQCGNTVDSEGTATRIDGELYQFCCPSCEARFEEKYEQLREGAD